MKTLLLLEMFLAHIRPLVEFHRERWEDLAQTFEQRYFLEHKLQRLSLAGQVDLQAHLTSGTRIDYMVALRKQLSRLPLP